MEQPVGVSARGSTGLHAWMHMRGAVEGGSWLGPACQAAGALVRYLPSRGGTPGALTSAGGLSRVAGLVGLRQAVWMRGAARLLTEVVGQCCIMAEGLLLRLTRSDPMASCK